jgi:hypothetical protein
MSAASSICLSMLLLACLGILLYTSRGLLSTSEMDTQLTENGTGNGYGRSFIRSKAVQEHLGPPTPGMDAANILAQQ